MIHLFPIEPIEKRYSDDWYRWWPKALGDRGFSVRIYDGDRIADFSNHDGIRTGEFLDAYDTHHYKATQLAVFMRQLSSGRVKDGDTVVLLDGWNPSVTALAYARAVGGINFKIVLVLHAGTWDPYDHLSKKGMGNWAGYVETGWMLACDKILLATYFHKKLLMELLKFSTRTWHEQEAISEKVVVTGFPLELDELNGYRVEWSQKKSQVVFPHRLAPEKQPDVFDTLKVLYHSMYPDSVLEWVRTQDTLKLLSGEIKPDFYRMLSESKVAFSSALQETWGIAQLEAWYLGAMPVVPQRLSYEELYPVNVQYETLVEAAHQIYNIVEKGKQIPFAPMRDPREAWDSIAEVLRGSP